MKITLEKKPEVTQMLKLMASRDYSVAQPAREAFAAFIQGAIQNVIEAEALLGSMFSLRTYDYGTPSTVPLAPLFDLRQRDFIKVWSQARAGGLVTANNMSLDELPVSVHDINSAVAFKLDYARAARVDVVAAYLQWLAQEVLIQQELDSAAVLTSVAAQSQYIDNRNQTGYQVYRTKTQGTVTVQDFNALATLMARINRPNIGGTPRGAARAITSLLGSPEFLEVIKNSAFQPQNTQAATTAIPSSDRFRDEIYNAAGNPSWYGTELIVSYDMGVGYAYNILFANASSGITYTGYNGGAAAAFSPYAEQAVIGLNRTNDDFLIRLAETAPDSSSTLSVQADSQWSNRSKEIGFFAELREGRIATDGRGVVTLVW